MRTYLQVVVVAFALMTAAMPAHAQSDSLSVKGEPTDPVDITPFVSLGSATSSQIGASIRFPLRFNLSAELEVGYRRSEMSALNANLNLLYDFPQMRRVTPYLAAGLGLEQYGTALEIPDRGVFTQPRLALAVNAGGGVKVAVDENWGVRTDARWFNGLGRTAGEHWRLYNGVTFRAGR